MGDDIMHRMGRQRTTLLQHEEQHHDAVASFYTKRRLTDFIWEVPEELFLFRRIGWQPEWKIVDMGCGPAVSVFRYLRKSNFESKYYTGVDISREMLKQAKKNIPDGTFIHADIETVSLPHASYDVLLSLGALHHSLDHKKTLKHWVSLVKPGGYLLLREPTIDAFRRGEGESPEEQGVEMHVIRESLIVNRCKIVSEIYFNCQVFHFINRVFNRILGNVWRETKWLWYPVVLFDALVSTTIPFVPYCKGLAVAIIVRKR